MKNIVLFFVILAIVSTSVFGASRKSKNPPVYRVVATAEQLAEAKKDKNLSGVTLDTNLVFRTIPAESPQWSTNIIEFDGTNRVIRISSPKGEKIVSAPMGFWASQKTSESAQVARTEVPQQQTVVYVTERPARTSWWNRPMRRSYGSSYGYSGSGYGGGMYTEKIRTSGDYSWNGGSYSGMYIGSGYGYQGSPSSYVIQPGQTYGERMGPYYGPAEVLIHQDNVYTLSGGIGGSTYR